MILIPGYKVADVRAGDMPVVRIMCSCGIIWERGRYLFLGSDTLWLPLETGVADMDVWSNTEWRAEADDACGIEIWPMSACLSQAAGSVTELMVRCAGEWTVASI